MIQCMVDSLVLILRVLIFGCVRLLFALRRYACCSFVSLRCSFVFLCWSFVFYAVFLFSFALHFALRCRPVGSGFEFVICARRPAGGGLIILRVDSDVTVMGQDT